MAQKCKPVKRSLVSHRREDHVRQLTTFVNGLVDGTLDDAIQTMADNVAPEKLENQPKIDDLITEMKALATGDMAHDVEMLNTYVDDHQTHPQSILLLREMVRTLRDGLDDAGKENLKAELMKALA